MLFVHTIKGQRMRKKSTKLLSFIIAIAMIFAWVPFNVVSNMIALASNDYAIHYNPDNHSFAAPNQSDRFTSQPITDILNPAFTDNVPVFSPTVSGWHGHGQNPNIVMGVYNTHEFDAFINGQFSGIDAGQIPHMFPIESSSSVTEHNVLVMASKNLQGTSANFSQTLPEFHADGFFRVTVDFMAVDTNTRPSAIYLTPTQSFVDGRQNPSITLNDGLWRTATFLIKTDALEEVTFNLALHLGRSGQTGTGAVYYDNVTVTAYSQTNFAPLWEHAYNNDNPLTSLVDLRVSHIEDIQLPHMAHYEQNSSIVMHENFNSSSNFIPLGNHSQYTAQIFPHIPMYQIPRTLNFRYVEEIHGTNTVHEGDGAMLVSAINSRAGVRYRNPLYSNDFSLQVGLNELFMISFYSLSTDDSFITIRDTRWGTVQPDFVDIFNSGFLPLQSANTPSADSRNGWVLNTIFLRGAALNDTNFTNLNIEFWVGGQNDATGYMLIDEFSIVKITQEYHDRHLGRLNSLEVNLDGLEVTADIDNSHFNLGDNRNTTVLLPNQNRTISARYPLIAHDWNVEIEGVAVTNHEEEDRIINGIVNTSVGHWARYGTLATSNVGGGSNPAYGPASNANPGRIGNRSAFNNIYMLQNVEPTHQRVTSSTFILPSDSINIISFYATVDLMSDDNVWAVIEVDGREVSRIRIESNIWREYTIEIQTSVFTSPSCTISFVMGDEVLRNTTGVMFIDDVLLNQIHTDTPDMTVNLSDASQLHRDGRPLFFENARGFGEETSILTFNQSYNILNIATPGNPKHARIVNTFTETITPGTRYRFTVYVPVNSMRVDAPAQGQNVLEDDYIPDWGISLTLIDGTDEMLTSGGFINLKNEDIQRFANLKGVPRMVGDRMEICIPFTFIIHPGQNIDLALQIEFGNELQPVVGQMSILETVLEEISLNEFNVLSNTAGVRVITTAVRPPDPEVTTPTPGFSFDWLIIPSLIMGLAVIIAVTGFTIRRIKFKKHIAKSHNTYARDDSRSVKSAPVAKAAPKKKATPDKPKRKLNND